MTGVDLAETVALVTGGRGVLGAAIASSLAEKGSTVAIGDIETASSEKNGEYLYLDLDVSSTESVESAFRTLDDRLGRLDILVNCAGYESSESVEHMTRENWQRMIDVHLTGTFLCSKWALPRMVHNGGGKIINISSQLAYKGSENLSHYCAAKAAVLGFTRAFAREAISSNVFVNAVAPGPVDSPVLRACGDEFIKRKLQEMPLGRLGRPDEIASTVLMLASEGGEFYVGQTLCPCGGDVMV